MKIISVIGTRPEIIKMSPLFELLNKQFNHLIIHSGQHYDPALDKELFKELKLSPPKIRLKTGSGNFGVQFPKQVQELYQVLEKEKPNFVIVQGDTNTALSTALAAARLNIKVIHVESGCRSGNLKAPEEQNRLMIDSIASILLCSDKKSLGNLKSLATFQKAFLVGSTTFDAVLRSSQIKHKSLLPKMKLEKEKYIVATLHRAEGMADLPEFKKRINYLNWVSAYLPVVFAIHPRTKKFLKKNKIRLSDSIIQVGPLKHLDFISLLKDCKLVITDSGGIQEEAAAFDRPCLILRKETEWTRLLKAGKNFLLPTTSQADKTLTLKLIQDASFYKRCRSKKCPESKPGASQKIVRILNQFSRA